MAGKMVYDWIEEKMLRVFRNNEAVECEICGALGIYVAHEGHIFDCDGVNGEIGACDIERKKGRR